MSEATVKELCAIHAELLARHEDGGFIDARTHAWDWSRTILDAATKLERLERIAALSPAMGEETGLAALPSPEPVADKCADCHTLDPVWSAPNELWNRVVGGPDATDDPGIRLCPTCFIRRAEAIGIAPVWHLAASQSPEPVAWQWSYLGDWFTMPMDKVEDAERYARSMAASTGGVARAIYAAPPSQREVIEVTEEIVEAVARALAADELGMGDPPAVVESIVKYQWPAFKRQARIASEAAIRALATGGRP